MQRAEGVGLGIRFLKHLARTSLLLHVVDLAPQDGSDPAAEVRAIEAELRKYDPELLERPRWLVMNKADLLAPEERDKLAKALVRKLRWKQPWFVVSAIARENTWTVCLEIQRHFDEHRLLDAEAAAEAAPR